MSSPSCSRSGGAVVAFDVVGTDTKAALFDTTGRMLGLSRTPTPHRGADTAGADLIRVQNLTLQFRRDSPDVTPIVASLIAGVLAPLPLVGCRFIPSRATSPACTASSTRCSGNRSHPLTPPATWVMAESRPGP